MSNSKEHNNETIEPGKLDETPEFYKGLANQPSIQRLRGMDIKVALPYIVEFLSGTFNSTSQELKFKTKFKKPPLVVGLYEVDEFSTKKTRQIFPNNQEMSVTTTTVTLGTVSFPMTPNYKYHLRVYNLDLFE